jgi:hypothetical protein
MNAPAMFSPRAMLVWVAALRRASSSWLSAAAPLAAHIAGRAGDGRNGSGAASATMLAARPVYPR